jgi:hypothetical protein
MGTWNSRDRETRRCGAAQSLGLVAALGFLVVVSLIVSTALTAFGKYLNSILPFGQLIRAGPATATEKD